MPLQASKHCIAQDCLFQVTQKNQLLARAEQQRIINSDLNLFLSAVLFKNTVDFAAVPFRHPHHKLFQLTSGYIGIVPCDLVRETEARHEKMVNFKMTKTFTCNNEEQIFVLKIM